MLETIIFLVIYFGGLIAIFLLGAKFGYNIPKNKVNIDNVCIEGFHRFVSNGSPNGTVRCQRCGMLEE